MKEEDKTYDVKKGGGRRNEWEKEDDEGREGKPKARKGKKERRTRNNGRRRRVRGPLRL